MKSTTHGIATSAVEVTNISAHGFWLLMDNREAFVAFDQNPWFKNAKIHELLNVQRLHGHHLHWPALDIDLEIESLDHPEQFPLIYK